MSKLVYLAGPITGCSYDGCTNWRDFAKAELAKHGIDGLSPMRQKNYLMREKIIADSYDDKVMSCAKGILARDRWDATRCDVLLANFLGAQKVSIGTIMEIAWADLSRIPIVLVMDKNNIHTHAMVREAVGFEVETLESGIEVVCKLLGE